MTLRSTSRDRHGRGPRSAVTGPLLPIVYNRIEQFFTIAMQTMQYLQSVWPNDLKDVRVDVLSNPPQGSPTDLIPRWGIDRAQNRITLYRIPITRMVKLHRDDELHRQMIIESSVFHAVAEYLGREPWELGAGEHDSRP